MNKKKKKVVDIYSQNTGRFFGDHYGDRNVVINNQDNQELKNDTTLNKDVKPIEEKNKIDEKSKEVKSKNSDSKKAKKLDEEQDKLIKEIIKLNKPHDGPKNVPNSQGCIIEIKDATKKFTNGYIINDVLKNINLTIKEGQFVVFLGKSGSGKTTLMNIMSGLNRATTGTTIVNGFNLINLSNAELTNFRRNYIGYIFQEYGLLGTLTVYENVYAGFGLNPLNKDKKVIDEILKDVNLLDHKKKYPAELSGGQQQRVAIARAIAKNPRIIFGDEPTGAVDTKMSETILNILRKVNREKHTTVVIITHDNKISKIADVVYTISDGNITSVKENPNPLEPKDIFIKS